MILPQFLVKKVPKRSNIRRIRRLLDDGCVQTVCEAASCPNIGECFSRNTLTFMILGNVCTRHCRFCGVAKGEPSPLDPLEPERIARAVQKLDLSYAVITSVTRDDLPDGGAGQFGGVIALLRSRLPQTRVEVLIPDFQGNEAALETVLAAGPDVLNHNVETVPRLYPKIRPRADYQRSLELLRRAKQKKPGVYTKSGFMVGLGERRGEVFQVVKDLKNAGCDIVTIGQYLSPSREQARVVRYVDPQEFMEFKRYGEELGLKVEAGPFVRSSYHAKDTAEALT